MTLIQLFEQPGSLVIFLLGAIAGFLLCWILNLLKGKNTRAGRAVSINAPAAQSEAGVTSPAVIAAITAAVNEYRKNNQPIQS